MALNKVWQYRVLCFGLTTAPHLFTRMVHVEPLAVGARGQGIHIHVDLDDWFILAKDEETLRLQTQNVLSKARKIFSNTLQKVRFLGYENRHSSELCTASSEEIGSSFTGSTGHPNSHTHIPETNHESYRNDGVSGRIDPVRNARKETNSVCTERDLERERELPRSKHPNLIRDEKRCPVVVHTTQYPVLSLSSGLERHSDDPDRCLHNRLGSSSRGQDGIRKVDTSGGSKSHQHPRDVGCEKGTRDLSGSPCRSKSTDPVRQHDSCIVHIQARGSEVLQSVSGSQRDPSVVQNPEHNSPVKTHSRQEECPCGSTESSRNGNLHRVETQSSNVQENHPTNMVSTSGSVRHSLEQPGTTVCLPISRQEGNPHGCIQSGLGLSGETLSVSSNGNNTTVPGEDRSVREHVPSSPTMLAKQGMVPTVAKTSHRLPSRDSSLREPVVSRSRSGKSKEPPKTRYNEISRVDAIRQSLVERGFPEEVAIRAAKPQRESTSRNYDSIWQKFVGWLDSRGISDPTKTTVQLIVLYLDHLQKAGRAVSTILVHKSAIVKTLYQITGFSLNESGTLADYLKNMKQNVPKNKLSFPKWELCVVLKGLRDKPFEPLDKVDIKYLTYKTVFLISLASAARVSEISALSAQEGFVRIKQDKSKVTLKPFEGFLAKNQTSMEPPREYSIKSLHQHIPFDDPERFLCPVRAIRIYLERTNRFRGDKRKLFISLCPNYSKEIGVNTISRWIRETIKLSYSSQKSSEIETLFRVSAHEVRAIATSLAAWRNVAIKDILKAAYWKSHNTFTDFYLRDMVSSTRKLNKQGNSVVCAGKELVLDI